VEDDHHIRRPTGGGDLITSLPLTAAPGAASSALDARLAVSVQAVRAISAALANFAAAGCTVTDGLLACQVTIPQDWSDGVPHQALIDALADYSYVHLRFERAQASFELSRTSGGVLDFMTAPTGDPSSVFPPDELAQAQRAWSGDIDAAQSLSGEWSGDLSVNLAAPLQRQDSGGRAWRAVRKIAVVADEVAAYPWWRAGELIRDGDRPVVIAVVDETGATAQTPAFAIVSLDRLTGSGPMPPGTGQRRVQLQSCGAGQLPDGLPLPEELEVSEGSTGATALADLLRPRADACAWAWLSNATTISADDAPAVLGYFGYRRLTFNLGAQGYIADAGQRALRMYLWATSEPSPDRVLAIRQVVSLYEQHDLPRQPEDVVRAAEPLYQALRAGEVAVVLESQRQARSMAVDTARGSADAAQSAAKSATERTIASLAAVAGIAVANATAVLSDADARAIAIGIAAIFLFLAGWAIFIEGPAMRAPLDSFAADLRVIGQLLSAADRTAILGMQALRKASRAVLRVRIAAPCVYIAGAVITIGVAHFKFGLRL
jgi:hypothetical protein